MTVFEEGEIISAEGLSAAPGRGGDSGARPLIIGRGLLIFGKFADDFGTS
jgi:hypothetical protein